MFILLNKPYGLLSQFTRPEGSRWGCLGDIPGLPAGVYAAGRLDADSEGLLLLTDDMRIRHRLTDPAFRHPRTYLAQVEGTPDDAAIRLMGSGKIVLDGRRTLPARARLLPVEPRLPPRPVPIRFRANIPTAWVELTLAEGRNRQVRKMTAAAGHPTLRLVRTGIGSLTLGSLSPGAWSEVDREEVISSLEGLAWLAAPVGPRPPRGRRGRR
jgi:23S rRNA pseudouridine2457 synthase